MVPEQPRNIVRTALLSIWGMVTLILVFTLGLLMYELYQQGESPYEIAMGTEPSSVAKIETPQVEQVLDEVQIFYASRSKFSLSPEVRRINLTGSTVENCRAVLSFLIDGPNLPTSAPIVSNRTKLRGMYLLENGELVLDFSRELEAGHVKSASAELLMVEGITKTLFQPSLKGSSSIAVSSIRFLFEGAPYQQSFPAHIDLSDPIRPKREVNALSGNSIDDA
jgi:hypothetical protein